MATIWFKGTSTLIFLRLCTRAPRICIFCILLLKVLFSDIKCAYLSHYSATVLDDGVDFVKLAEAMGATGYRATSQAEFVDILKKALASSTPVVIDCIIDSDDKVWPMVAPGAAISEVFTEEDLK